MPDSQLVKLIAQQAGVSSPGQLLRYLSDSILPSGVKFKNEPHCLSLLRDDGQLAVLFVIPPQTVVAQHMTVLDRLSEPEFQTLRIIGEMLSVKKPRMTGRMIKIL